MTSEDFDPQSREDAREPKAQFDQPWANCLHQLESEARLHVSAGLVPTAHTTFD